MMDVVKDSFLDLERHRRILHDSIEKLRISLRHWHLWTAEYEGLKEEILAATGSTPTRDELLRICGQYHGELVTKKEINDILGTEKSRHISQIVNILERRIDYVEQNICTIKKQIEAAEKRLAAASIISAPEVRNEEGLPLTEITEELDEDGIMISSHISTPGRATPQLLEVLQKAGVKDLTIASALASDTSLPVDGDQHSPTLTVAKKAVTFAEDTKPGPETSKSLTAARLEEIMKISKSQEFSASQPPIMPADEAPNDAALRREMLNYGMSELGAVVAELNLEEASDWSDDYLDEEETSDSDEEDAFGRSTGRVVDLELRQQMIELEERLGAHVMQNVGQKASDYDVVEEGIGRVAIRGETVSETAKKSVRFANELKNSPAPAPGMVPEVAKPVAPATIPAAPVGEVERAAPAETPTIATPFQVSVYPANRPASVTSSLARPSPAPASISDTLPQSLHNGPVGITLAPLVVERETPRSRVTEPGDNDAPLNHAIATEYYRMRNTMIQRQGGFLRAEKSDRIPLSEEEGGPRRMSLFRAARLARS